MFDDTAQHGAPGVRIGGENVLTEYPGQRYARISRTTWMSCLNPDAVDAALWRVSGARGGGVGVSAENTCDVAPCSTFLKESANAVGEKIGAADIIERERVKATVSAFEVCEADPGSGLMPDEGRVHG